MFQMARLLYYDELQVTLEKEYIKEEDEKEKEKERLSKSRKKRLEMLKEQGLIK